MTEYHVLVVNKHCQLVVRICTTTAVALSFILVEQFVKVNLGILVSIIVYDSCSTHKLHFWCCSTDEW